MIFDDLGYDDEDPGTDTLVPLIVAGALVLCGLVTLGIGKLIEVLS